MKRLLINEATLELVQGNIVKQDTDAIVNAANSGLRGGGGVDGAIHAAGGPSIMEECRRIGGCPTGSAVLTGAGKLRAQNVIHAVGPIYHGQEKDAKLLAGAYRNSLLLAKEHGLQSVAFPSISTGAYRYPINKAAGIALGTVMEFLRENSEIILVRFVLFSQSDYEAYAAALDALT